MAASTQIQLRDENHSLFIEYYKKLQDTQKTFRNKLRYSMLETDRSYQREHDKTVEQRRAAAANAAGDSTKYQNQTVPIVKPQVETATAYQAEVFLTGIPLFGVVSHPDNIDEALQLETILDNQAIRGGWTREFMLSFRDGYKYDFAPMETVWKQEVVQSIITDPTFHKTQGKPEEVIWAGNALRRIDPYNIIADPNVMPSMLYKEGDFGGYTEVMSRMKLKLFISSLVDKQTRDQLALESGSGVITSDITSHNYYVPIINERKEGILSNGETNWVQWAGLKEGGTMQYSNHYEVTTLYCRIMPGEFKLFVPGQNTPQIWKLIIVNHKVIIFCERQTNAHGYIPITIGQPAEDGLAYQTKSLAEDAAPFQHVATALMNSVIHSRRRAVGDRVLYDPSRIAPGQINNESSVAKIPVKPAAYGKKISDAVYAFPYREDPSGMGMAQVQETINLADQLGGQNPARQGQFVKGNKTREEFSGIMGNAVSRDKMASILYEAQVFMPMKHILKLNILQHQTSEALVSREKQRSVDVDPVKLRKAVLDFKLSDGLLPSSKIIGGEPLSTALQTIGSSPQLAGGYNITPMFSYLMKIQGADLRPFEKSPEQIAYEQAVGQWQSLMQLALEKGFDQEKLKTEFPPQPLPEQFGYNPNPNAPTKKGQSLLPTGDE